MATKVSFGVGTSRPHFAERIWPGDGMSPPLLSVPRHETWWPQEAGWCAFKRQGGSAL